jgi:hypothetical protein
MWKVILELMTLVIKTYSINHLTLSQVYVDTWNKFLISIIHHDPNIEQMSLENKQNASNIVSR